MTTTAATTEILLSYLSTGIRSAQDIRHRLNCSQPTVSRLLSIVSQKIITIGNARARRYARLRAMLPMVYRPVDGAVPAQTFIPPSAAPKAPEAWDTALKCALLFWERAAKDPRISDGFRSICSVNYMLLQQLSNGPRLIG